MYCFGCLPKSEEKIWKARKEICLPRKSHRPTGDPIVHEHFPGLATFVCADCGILGVKEGADYASFKRSALEKEAS